MNSVVQIVTHCGSNVAHSSKVISFGGQNVTQTKIIDGTKTGSIFFITSNPGKLREVNQILGLDFPFKIEPVNLDLEEIQDEDPDVIAITKCKEAVERLSNHPLIIEDSCLSFHALNGLPGPYVKWFEKKIGNDGLVRLLSGFEDKTASAIASISFWDGKEMFVFRGVVQGTIVPPRGPQPSFGWDPIFLPCHFDKTYAELGSDTKNEISHRAKALDLFKNHVKQFMADKIL